MRVLRFLLESAFLVAGLYYLLRVFASSSVDGAALRLLLTEPACLGAAALFAAQYLLVAWGFSRAMRGTVGEGKQVGYPQVCAACALSSLGKYIPGKVLSFLAFAHLGRRFGISFAWTGALFAMNLCLSLVLAALACALRLLPGLWGGLAWAVLLPLGLLLPRILPGVVDARWPRLGRIWGFSGLFWTVQWANTTAGGLAYALLGLGLGTATDISFRQAGAYPAAYAAGVLFFFVPAGLGVREAALAWLDQGTLKAGVQIVAARLLTTALDLLVALVALPLLLRRNRRISGG